LYQFLAKHQRCRQCRDNDAILGSSAKICATQKDVGDKDEEDGDTVISMILNDAENGDDAFQENNDKDVNGNNEHIEIIEKEGDGRLDHDDLNLTKELSH
jgi:hypothetical protein